MAERSRIEKYVEKKFNHSSNSIDLRARPGPKIGDVGCEYLSKLLKEQKRITNIDLRGNKISAKGCSYLVEVLHENNTIKKLNLKDNKIRAEGCAHLAKMIKDSHSIKTLDISGNFIKDEGCCELAEGLKYNTTITQIKLGENEISSEGCSYLVEALQRNINILELDLKGNPIKLDTRKIVESWLDNNKKIKEYGASKMKRGKMVVLGDGRVGKTCLIRSLNGFPFQPQQSTQVLSMDSVKFGELNVEVTDFGGQDIYRCVHSLMMSDNCVYLLVFNSKLFKSDHLDWWIDSLKHLVDFSKNKIDVVFTHCDDYTPMVPANENVDDIFKVDNKSKHGIQELKECVYNQFYSNKIYSMTFSKIHEQLIDCVKRAKDAFQVSLSEFHSWAEKKDFHNEENIQLLLSFFHETNDLFYFPKTKQINDIVWTDPHGFIEGFRSVLSADQQHSQYFNDGILWNHNINNAFQYFVQNHDVLSTSSSTQERSISSTISGLIDLLLKLNLIFPIKSKDPPFKILGYIVPSRLPNENSDKARQIISESYKVNQVIIRSFKIPELFLTGLFGRLMSKLWKYMIEESYSKSCFCLEYNKTKAIIRNFSNSGEFFIIVFGKHPIKLFSMIYYSTIDLLKQMGMNVKTIESHIKALCSYCYQTDKIEMGSWRKEFVIDQFLKNSIYLRCDMCQNNSMITDLLFDENVLYIAYNYGTLLFEYLENGLSHIQLSAMEMGIHGDSYPIFDNSTSSDQERIKQNPDNQDMNDWKFLKRLGYNSQGEYHGKESAVYLCKSNITDLDNPDRFYAIKIVYNIFCISDEEQILKSEYNILKDIEIKRTFVRQLCHFTARLNTSILPDWDAKIVKDGVSTLFVVSDAYDGILKHKWPSIQNTPMKMILGYILQILNGLKDLQEQNIIHCDIKSDNVFYYSPRDCFLIADFGNAIPVNSQMSIEQDATNWGSLNSKPPEVENSGIVDLSKADIFSTGLMLLYVMTQDTKSNEMYNADDSRKVKFIKDRIPSYAENIQYLLFGMIRHDFESRITVSDAFNGVQYLLWGEYDKLNGLEKWKKDRIQSIALNETIDHPLTMTEILELEYVSSLTEDKIQEGKKQINLLAKEFQKNKQRNKVSKF
eukprot:gb/GECH01010503.1/.p1 GENE.gb/GECH01010503.1/~~gb/GECH01010503.1/.p1  ORF type:complete len:1117 (+),score=214.81 gb/GECH01010503.1/:1-3351(+)